MVQDRTSRSCTVFNFCLLFLDSRLVGTSCSTFSERKLLEGKRRLFKVWHWCYIYWDTNTHFTWQASGGLLSSRLDTSRSKKSGQQIEGLLLTSQKGNRLIAWVLQRPFLHWIHSIDHYNVMHVHVYSTKVHVTHYSFKLLQLYLIKIHQWLSLSCSNGFWSLY